MDQVTEDEQRKTNELIGTMAQTLLDDMSRNADITAELREQKGYHRGYDEGFIAGQASVAREMRSLLFGVQAIASRGKEDYDDVQ